MDHSSIVNIILNSIGTPFHLSIFGNDHSMSIRIDQELPSEVIQDIESQLKQLVSKVCLEIKSEPDRVLINLEH
jgi:hypothetical protein